MKNYRFLFSLLLLCNISLIRVSAQIEIPASGNVIVSKKMAIGTNADSDVSLNISHLSKGGVSPYYGIKSHIMTWSSMPTSPICAIMGYADAWSSKSSYPISPIIGVYGKALKNSGAISNFSAGVAGMAHYYGGIAIYGGIGSDTTLNLPSTWKGGAYAGYFDGSVKVSGTLTATSISTSSDYRLKENINNLDKSIVNAVSSLRPVSYTHKPDSTNIVYGVGEKEMQVAHFGLIAQEVQKVLPNLVYEGGDGYLSINYTELIPILIMSIQKLSNEVKDLNDQLEVIKNANNH